VRANVESLRRVSGAVKATGTVILCYHRVAEGVEDPFRLCVRPENFAAQLEEIVRTREPSTLSDLSMPSRRPRVVVTFDDGYRDNLDNALPIAASKGVPLTVFVTSGMLGDQRGFWWDRLAALLRGRPPGVKEISLVVHEDVIVIPLGERGDEADLATVRGRLMSLSVREIEAALDAVSAQWSVASTAPADARALTPDEFLQLAASEMVTIGAHTVDHVRLRGRSSDVQLQTIEASRKGLEEILDRSVTHFAYPFGGHDDFDDDTVEAVRAAGFETACTTLPGSAGLSSDPYRLPRRLVMDWGRLRFRAQLQRWRFG
jgi:peptidoglycan/xylan/chitin deacetylase (PgdA/CDA1 family)